MTSRFWSFPQPEVWAAMLPPRRSTCVNVWAWKDYGPSIRVVVIILVSMGCLIHKKGASSLTPSLFALPASTAAQTAVPICLHILFTAPLGTSFVWAKVGCHHSQLCPHCVRAASYHWLQSSHSGEAGATFCSFSTILLQFCLCKASIGARKMTFLTLQYWFPKEWWYLCISNTTSIFRNYLLTPDVVLNRKKNPGIYPNIYQFILYFLILCLTIIKRHVWTRILKIEYFSLIILYLRKTFHMGVS